MTEVTTAQLTGGLAAVLVGVLAVVGLTQLRAELGGTATSTWVTAEEGTAPAPPPPSALHGAPPSMPEEPTTYRVASGDTLSAIAGAVGVPMEVLLDENGLDAPHELEVGQELRIPPPGDQQPQITGR
jgi:LysM repeat protein